MNLGFILNGNKLLLGMKKRGFGAGRWNGYGGKVKEGETIEGALVREMEEEATIKVKKLEQFGLINFYFEGGDLLEVHFFRILEYTGTPTETEEMKPNWFETNKIPFESMWPDDPHWMPLFLAGKKFNGNIYFKDTNTITKIELKEVTGF
jgi:8-oxo-dGTP diphosphatase/2-hydroxy-dATP diphosphatase